MWISKQKYKDMKNCIEFLEGIRSDLEHQLYITRAQLGAVRRGTVIIYPIDIILRSGKVIPYNIAVHVSKENPIEEAKRVALDKFLKDNKNFTKEEVAFILHKKELKLTI